MGAEPVTAANEIRLALDILDPLTKGAIAELVGEEDDTLRFRVPRRIGWRLRVVVLSKRALRNLATDPAAEVKIEYLRRDMERIAPQRAEYRYPHATRVFSGLRAQGPGLRIVRN